MLISDIGPQKYSYRMTSCAPLSFLEAVKDRYASPYLDNSLFSSSNGPNDAATHISHPNWTLIGMDKTFTRQSALHKLRVATLQRVTLHEMEDQIDGISDRLPLLKELYLEEPVVHYWKDIQKLITALPQLRLLHISRCAHRMKFSVCGNTESWAAEKTDHSKTWPSEVEDDQKRIWPYTSSVENLSGFKQLHTVILNNCAIEWNDIVTQIPNFSALRELHLESNHLRELSNSEPENDEKCSSLCLLNLSNNELHSWRDLALALRFFPCTKNLMLTGNAFTNFYELEYLGAALPYLESLSIENCPFEPENSDLSSYWSIRHLGVIQKLKCLRLTYTTFCRSVLGNHEMRLQRIAIACQIPKLEMLNGSSIQHTERKEMAKFYVDAAKRINQDLGLSCLGTTECTPEVQNAHQKQKVKMSNFLVDQAKVLAQTTSPWFCHYETHNAVLRTMMNSTDMANNAGQNKVHNQRGMDRLVKVILRPVTISQSDIQKALSLNMSILQLKRLVRTLFAIPPQYQRLSLREQASSHSGVEINDDVRDLHYYGVADNSIIEITDSGNFG